MARFSAMVALLVVLGIPAGAQAPPAKTAPGQAGGQYSPPGQQAEPHTEGESSSKDTKVSLAPPAGEEGLAPGLDPSDSNVREMTPWDPLKADKNVEIGNYYMTQKNVPAAISRYREALYWKQDDAIAHLKLGQALEADGQYAEARINFEAYLKILPQGKFAPLAHKSLNHMKGKADVPKKPEVPSL
jgi:tetratricopeptide (TPR) repeat protein